MNERDGKCSSSLVDAILIFAFLLAVYTLTYSGSFRVDDEHILAARSQSLALWGELTQPQVYGNDRMRELAALPDEQGAQATAIEPALTFLGASLYRLAASLNLSGGQTLFTLNIYLTAITGAVIFLTVLQLGYRRDTAIWSAILFGLGTMAWPYATTFYRDSLAMLMAAVAFLGWAMVVRGRSGDRILGIILITGGSLCGVLAKNTSWALLPAFLVGMATIWLREPNPVRHRVNLFISLLGAMALCVLLAIIMPPKGVFARYSLEYFTFLAKFFLNRLDLNLVPAFLGPFISPAKSLLLFSPPLFLAVYASLRSWSADWRFGLPAWITTGLLALGQALFYGQTWAGSFGWGLRFALPALPALVAVGASAVERISTLGRKVGRAILWSLLGISSLVQLAGTVVDWHTAYDYVAMKGLDPYSPYAAWSVTHLAIPPHLARLMDVSSWQAAWVRVLSGVPLGTSMILTVFVLLAVGALWGLRLWRREHLPGRRVWLVSGTLVVVLLILPIFPMLRIFDDDPAVAGNRPELTTAIAWVHEDGDAEDVVVIDSYGTPLWTACMYRWTSAVRWYSLPYEIPGSDGKGVVLGSEPSTATIELFYRLSNAHTRLWYITSDEAPDSGLGREVVWLDSRFRLVERQIFSGNARVEVRLYEFAGSTNSNARNVP